MMMFEWIDGQPVGAPGQQVPRGFWVGEALYETFLVAGDAARLPRLWPLHRARFAAGAAQLGLPWPGDEVLERQLWAALTQVRAEAAEVAEDTEDTEGRAPWWRVRLTLAATGPASLYDAPTTASVWLRIQPALTRLRPPARMALGPQLRNPADPMTGIKRITMASDLVAVREARRAGWDDVVFRDVSGHLSEASTAALLFGLSGGRLATPAPETAPLPSTTLALIEAAGIEVEPVRWQPEALADVTWAVALNAVQGACPITAIGQYTFAPPPPALIARVRGLVDDGEGEVQRPASPWSGAD